MTSPALRTHVDVVLAALTTAGLKPYRGVGPADPLATAPYCVVYAGTAQTGGPMGAMWSDVMPEVQVTSIGRRSDQAELWNDKVFAALIGAALAPPAGRAWLRPSNPAGHVLTRPVERDDDYGVANPLFYQVSIFELPSTPA